VDSDLNLTNSQARYRHLDVFHLAGADGKPSTDRRTSSNGSSSSTAASDTEDGQHAHVHQYGGKFVRIEPMDPALENGSSSPPGDDSAATEPTTCSGVSSKETNAEGKEASADDFGWSSAAVEGSSASEAREQFFHLTTGPASSMERDCIAAVHASAGSLGRIGFSNLAGSPARAVALMRSMRSKAKDAAPPRQ